MGGQILPPPVGDRVPIRQGDLFLSLLLVMSHDNTSFQITVPLSYELDLALSDRDGGGYERLYNTYP